VTRSLAALTAALAVVLVIALPVRSRAADDPKPVPQDVAQSPQMPPAAPAKPDEDDAVLKLAEPDFTLIGLPTSLRVPKFKSAFRVTHRFTRPLGRGSFGNLLADGFGLDNGAVIGLEYRFGIVPNGEIGIHRTSGRTIEFFGQYGLSRQGKKLPVEVSALASIDGTNNFKDSYSPALGLIVTRLIGDQAALYVEPIWVNNTNPLPKALVDHNDTFMVGLGARVRIRPTVYVVGEVAPRAAGFRPGVNHGSIAIEKRAGGHLFQLNFSNAFGTTMGQIARGGPANKDWYMGFNITRKFY
jgi:hypothetical protein